MAVDSRASLGTFIGSKTVQKVLPIHPKLLGTMAGGAADCSYWIRKLAAEAALYEALHPQGKRMSVARASRLLSNYLYGMRGLELSVGSMIMGYDEDGDGQNSHPHLFYVDNLGTRIEGDMFSVGSGSTFALGVVDRHQQQNKDRMSPSFTKQQAVRLAVEAIRYATFRDGSSGGFINVYHMSPGDSGFSCVFRQDVAAIPTTAFDNDGVLDERFGNKNDD